jgi:hypothetical protein
MMIGWTDKCILKNESPQDGMKNCVLDKLIFKTFPSVAAAPGEIAHQRFTSSCIQSPHSPGGAGTRSYCARSSKQVLPVLPFPLPKVGSLHDTYNQCHHHFCHYRPFYTSIYSVNLLGFSIAKVAYNSVFSCVLILLFSKDCKILRTGFFNKYLNDSNDLHANQFTAELRNPRERLRRDRGVVK